MKSIKISLSIDDAKSTVIHQLEILSQERDDFKFHTYEHNKPGISYQSFLLQLNSDWIYNDLGTIKLRKIGDARTDLTVFDPEWKKEPTPILFRTFVKKDELKYLQEKGSLNRQLEQFEQYLASLIVKRDEIVSDLELALKKDGVLEKTILKEKETTDKSALFVSPSRIKQLRAIKSPDYDLKKLVRLCEELNYCFNGKCYFAVAILVRTILDYVPPIFGDYRTFKEVANSYGGPTVDRSLKDVFRKLEESARGIADYHIHMPVSKEPSLPNKIQVNYSQELDFLLGEIIRVIKKKA